MICLIKISIVKGSLERMLADTSWFEKVSVSLYIL